MFSTQKLAVYEIWNGFKNNIKFIYVQLSANHLCLTLFAINIHFMISIEINVALAFILAKIFVLILHSFCIEFFLLP